MRSLPRYLFRSFLMGLLVITALTGCSTTNSSNQVVPSQGPISPIAKVTLVSPKAPSLLPALLVEQQKEAGIELKVETWDTMEQLLARIQNNDAQFIAAPLNVGANIYKKGLPLQLLHVNTWGSMYLISLDPNVHSLPDMANKTVYIPGQGGPPDILTRYLIKKEGLEGQIKLAYGVIPDIMQQLAAGTIKYAVLPEPVLSGLRLKSANSLIEVIDYQKSWRASFGEDLPQTGVFVNPAWAKAHPTEIAQFQTQYQKALNEMVKKPGTALKLAEGAFGLPEAALVQAMPHISLIFKNAVEAKPEVERYFNILLQADPDSIGGSLPDAGFYYGF
ncbi:hypothetical protein GCM10008018_41690 [Paenibacillus marchantiophytorum]|uniref:SsuA/THI5-like domain-containing protein n=1 Tax=Paenibacillus marchantiophytorum TaxID=1619310 RepID=A0ABQ1EWU8_9BACL|nr:ABC transporter substrate-binding protein [Paenibacillus marchantiophytorum]GFZ91048.1 hypothetical protein GCM10008018_41690 [Paenibacillus marchantiophytorum]